jgi:hypothetical protein
MICPECGAENCQARFDEFLVLEFTDTGYGAVHHLTVATYMLQHSSKLTREGWLYERELLKEFIVEKKSPVLIRKQRADLVDSGNRNFTFKSKDGKPVIAELAWTKTIRDVRAENAGVYSEDVTEWAKSVLDDSERVEPI